MLGILGLSAVPGAISGATKKAVSGDDAICRGARKGATKGANKEGRFVGTLLAGLAASLILNSVLARISCQPSI